MRTDSQRLFWTVLVVLTQVRVSVGAPCKSKYLVVKLNRFYSINVQVVLTQHENN